MGPIFVISLDKFDNKGNGNKLKSIIGPSCTKSMVRLHNNYLDLDVFFFLILIMTKRVKLIFVWITKPLMCALKDVWMPKLKIKSWMDSTTYPYLPSLHKTQAKNLVKCQGCMNKLMQIALFSCFYLVFFSSFFLVYVFFFLNLLGHDYFAYRLIICSLFFNILSEKFDRLF